MELNKAIEVVKNIDTTDIHCMNCVLEEKDKCITDLFGYSCQRIAIDTVLEELNNRTPKERINEQIRFLNDEGYFEFNTKRDLEKATEILNNLLSKE